MRDPGNEVGVCMGSGFRHDNKSAVTVSLAVENRIFHRQWPPSNCQTQCDKSNRTNFGNVLN